MDDEKRDPGEAEQKGLTDAPEVVEAAVPSGKCPTCGRDFVNS